MTATLNEQIVTFAQQRLDYFGARSLHELWSDSEAFLQIPESLVDTLTRRRGEVSALLAQWQAEAENAREQSALLTLLSYHTRRVLKRHNQFLAVAPATVHMLANVYRYWLGSLCSILQNEERPLQEALRAMLLQHRTALRDSIELLGFTPSQVDHGPICHEYSPQLQIGLLGLDTRGGVEPLLDLGCGEDARLVKVLRRRDVQAYGLDAFAPTKKAYLARGDWLTWPLGEARWKTVVSHMAFSHHFLHHHLKGGDWSVAYARRYVDILRSLQPGGNFIYTPGLPFMEDLLPRDQFEVERRPRMRAQEIGADDAITMLVGTSTFYSVRVRRRT